MYYFFKCFYCKITDYVMGSYIISAKIENLFVKYKYIFYIVFILYYFYTKINYRHNMLSRLFSTVYSKKMILFNNFELVRKHPYLILSNI